jgi:hypothetical protein
MDGLLHNPDAFGKNNLVEGPFERFALKIFHRLGVGKFHRVAGNQYGNGLLRTTLLLSVYRPDPIMRIDPVSITKIIPGSPKQA